MYLEICISVGGKSDVKEAQYIFHCSNTYLQILFSEVLTSGLLGIKRPNYPAIDV